MHVLELAKAQIAQGDSVIVATPQGGWLFNQCQQHNIAVLGVGMHGVFDFISLIKLVITARKVNANIMHGHMVKGGHYAQLTAKLCGIKSVTTSHDIVSYKRMHRAHAVIACANAVKQFLITKNIPAHKIHTIYNGVPSVSAAVLSNKLTTAQTIRSALAISNDTLVYVQIGRFVRGKRQDLSIQALATLSQQDAQKRVLLLLGDTATEWGEQCKQLYTQLKTAHPTLDVRFLGDQPKVIDYALAADVGLLPSDLEAFPLSVLEMHSVGLPVIASKVGGVPEIINENCGLMFSPNNLAEYLARITQYEHNPMLRVKHGKNALLQQQQKFSTQGLAANLRVVYQQITLGQ